MNDSVQRGRPDERLFRIEKRLSILIPVYLASLHDPRNREQQLPKISVSTARVSSASGPGGLVKDRLLPVQRGDSREREE